MVTSRAENSIRVVNANSGDRYWTTDFTGESSFSLVEPSDCYYIAIRTSPTNTQSIIVNGLFECLDM